MYLCSPPSTKCIKHTSAESNRTNKKSGWNGMELQLVMTRFINLGMQEAQLRPTWGKEIIHGEVDLDWGELARWDICHVFRSASPVPNRCEKILNLFQWQKLYIEKRRRALCEEPVYICIHMICLHRLPFLLLSDPICCVECWLSEKYTIVSRYHLCNILSWFDRNPMKVLL